MNRSKMGLDGVDGYLTGLVLHFVSYSHLSYLTNVLLTVYSHGPHDM